MSHSPAVPWRVNFYQNVFLCFSTVSNTKRSLIFMYELLLLLYLLISSSFSLTYFFLKSLSLPFSSFPLLNGELVYVDLICLSYFFNLWPVDRRLMKYLCFLLAATLKSEVLLKQVLPAVTNHSFDLIPIPVVLSRQLCLIFLPSIPGIPCLWIMLVCFLCHCGYSWCAGRESTIIPLFLSLNVGRKLWPFPCALRRYTDFIPWCLAYTDFCLCLGQSYFCKNFWVFSEFSFCSGSFKSLHSLSVLWGIDGNTHRRPDNTVPFYPLKTGTCNFGHLVQFVFTEFKVSAK